MTDYLTRRVTEEVKGEYYDIQITLDEPSSDENGRQLVKVLAEFTEKPAGTLFTHPDDPNCTVLSLGKWEEDRQILPHVYCKIIGNAVMELAKRHDTEKISFTLPSHSGPFVDYLQKMTGFAVQQALLPAGEKKSKAAAVKLPSIQLIASCATEVELMNAGVQLARYNNVARLLTGLPTDEVGVDAFAELILSSFRNQEGCTLPGNNGEPTPDDYQKMGLLQAVGQCATEKPRVVIVEIDPASGATRDRNFVVAKGVVNDTGGINLKPDGGLTMRGDMGGAAAAFAAALYAAEHRDELLQTVVFAFGIVDNAIGSDAYRPGSMLTAYDGSTVEVLNTDAEGRLVLRDLVLYMSDIYVPHKHDTFISIATLTGGAVISCGKPFTALYFKDSPWRMGRARDLENMGFTQGDPVQVLHTDAGDIELLASTIADIANIAGANKERHTQQGGVFITSAVPEDVDYLHLDIGGSAGDLSSGGRGCQPGTSLPGGVNFLIAYLTHIA